MALLGEEMIKYPRVFELSSKMMDDIKVPVYNSIIRESEKLGCDPDDLSNKQAIYLWHCAIKALGGEKFANDIIEGADDIVQKQEEEKGINEGRMWN